MGRFNECSTKVSLQYNLTQEQLSQLAQDIKDVVSEAKQSNLPINKIIEDTISRKVHQIEMTHLQTLKTIDKYETNRLYLQQDGFKNLNEALYSLLEPLTKTGYEGIGSVTTRTKGIRNQLLGEMTPIINKYKLEPQLRDGSLDIEIFRGVIDGKVSKNPAVNELVSAIRRSNNMLLHMKRNAGVAIGEIENYLIKQTHNAKGILELGNGNETIARNKFMDLMLKTTDYHKSGFNNIEDYKEFINKMFDGRMSSLADMHGLKLDTKDFKEIITAGTVSRMGSSRTIQFKDGESFYEYYKALNKDTNLMETILRSHDAESSKIAAMEIFGPNYKAGWLSLLAEGRKLSKEKSLGTLEQFDMKQKNLEKSFKAAVEGEFQGQMNRIAKTGRILRQITDMSKLGYSGLTTFTDLSFGGGIISPLTGKSYSQSLIDMSADTMKLFVNKENLKKVADKTLMFLEDTLDMTANTRFGDYGRVEGGLDKVHNMYMKMTGLARQSLAARLAVAKNLFSSLHDLKDLEFNSLPAKQSFDQFGITADDWKIMQKGSDMEMGMITAENIINMSDVPMSRRLEVISKMQQWASFYAELGSPTMGLKQRTMKAAFDRNTYAGQIFMSIMQYKSFSLAVLETMQATYNLGGARNLAKTVASSTALGAGVLYLKALAQGKALPQVTDTKSAIKFMGEAFLQSGSGSLYADFLFNDYRKNYMSVASQVAGPIIGGPVSDLGVLVAEALRADYTDPEGAAKVKRRALIALEKNAPSFPYTKNLINANIFNEMHKMLHTRRRPKENRFTNDWDRFFE